MPSRSSSAAPRHLAGQFATTRWSLIERARGIHESQARAALETLCQTYWYPLYAFVRRQGSSIEDAEDLVQGFLASLLHRDDILKTSPDKGRFRSFLLASLKHYLSKQRERARAAKRGGGQQPISFDSADAETRYQHEPADLLTPDRLYERQWALAVLENALDRLRVEYAEQGKSKFFERLKSSLTGDRDSLPYAELARQLGLTEANVKVSAHRLRRRYRELLRAEIAHTVNDPSEIEPEIQHLFQALGA